MKRSSSALLGRGLIPCLTVAIVLLSIAAVCNGQKSKAIFYDPDPKPSLPYQQDLDLEFKEFCTAQEASRNNPEKIDKEDCKRIHELDFQGEDLNILFMIFFVLLYGAIVRSILVRFQITIPYTVFMMTSGMAVGVASKYYCYEMYTYTAFARLYPKLYLTTFLPVLLFESSFSMSGHVFLKAATQVLILAGPGMLMCTFLTAAVCYLFFVHYNWSFMEAVFFGSIISATDPVAVVAILKELGVSQTLSVLVDGESLLNDGVAILLYEVVHDLLKHAEHPHSMETVISHIIADFFRIAIGGPVFGWFMARIVIFSLSRIFNDAVVEITLTLCGTYLTYYIGESVLGVSGVMAVVILGITMNYEKTCISPETEHELHDFWAMLGHLANTVLFFITGIIITERGTRGLGWVDLYYLILLYCSLNLIRFIMLMIASPILSRIGYGMPWQNMMVMMWGGLRGAVGICLSLDVYEDPTFCSTSLGPEVLIQTAGIVFLTLTINGTTTKKLLQVLKLTEISQGRMEEMKNAVKSLHITQKRALAMLRHDRFLSDANWSYVMEHTRIEDPYKHQQPTRKTKADSSILSLGPDVVTNTCPGCNTEVPIVPNNEELRSMTDEARLRVIKAMKISYWTHFEKGVLTEVAVQILASTADSCADKELYMIHARDLKRYWQIRGVFPWLRRQLVKQIGEGKGVYDAPPPPAKPWRKNIWWVITRAWFDYIIIAIVLLNMIPAVWEMVYESRYGACKVNEETEKMQFLFEMINLAFTSIYLIEFGVKILGLGAQYWQSRWNWLDFGILVIAVADVVLDFMSSTFCGAPGGRILQHLYKIIKIIRCCRCIKLLRPLTPVLMDFINGKINTQLFLGYDVTLGFIMGCGFLHPTLTCNPGCDDVMKYLPHMIEEKRVYNKIRLCIEKERMEAVREMGMLQKSHPGIAIAIKTRHASRSVLNQMKATLFELRSDGLLDEKENDLLTLTLVERMKNLLFSPNYIAPPGPEDLIANINWIYGHNELRQFILDNATLLQYEIDDVIIKTGDPPQGIYIIVSGMVRIRYEPNDTVKADREKYGAIPTMEFFKNFDFDKSGEDLFSSGFVIGESACLTGRVRSATVTCETEGVTAFHIPLSAVQQALESFNDQYNSLEERLWRSSGMRRAAWFLNKSHLYTSCSIEKIKAIIERSCSPIGPQFEVIRVPSFVQDIVVIEGWVEDGQNGQLYIAPALVPRNCTSIKMRPNPKTLNRILVVLQEDVNPDPNDPDDLAQCLHASRKFRKYSIDENLQSPADDSLTDGKQRRVSVAVNFGVQHGRGSRKSLGYGEKKARKSLGPTRPSAEGRLSKSNIGTKRRSSVRTNK